MKDDNQKGRKLIFKNKTGIITAVYGGGTFKDHKGSNINVVSEEYQHCAEPQISSLESISHEADRTNRLPVITVTLPYHQQGTKIFNSQFGHLLVG